MNSFRIVTVCCVLVLLLISPFMRGAQSKVSESEAAKLGNELTPMGAIQAGNEEGTIPAWEGGIKEPPSGYVTGMHHPDPFAEDEILFTITADNASDYAETLSPGQMAMFERYPETWFVSIYPTRRSASFPQRVYDACISNAMTAELIHDGNGVAGAGVGPPFPIPQSGLEAIWNFLMRYRAPSTSRTIGQAAVTPGGAYTMVILDEKLLSLYSRSGATTETIDNLPFYLLQTIMAPARLAGRILLVHDTLDQVVEPRRAWTYNPGQRRVRRAPNIAYDNPGTASDGLRTNDQFDMYNGAPDRYTWELLGRQEMYVPYNCYELHSDALAYDQIVQPGHLNPEHLRYELHRVWVVEAKLKEGTSHIYARRTFCLDEDSWNILTVDQYDGRGQIWRVSEAYTINYYDHPFIFTTLEVHYDLQNGRYLAHGLNNEGRIERFDSDLSPKDFTPAGLRQMGRR